MLSILTLIKKIKVKAPKIDWHAWPEPDTIISRYEVIVYILFAAFFVILYGLIQIVPVHKDTITVDRVQLDYSRIEYEDTLSVLADIQYYSPMTFALKSNGSLGTINIRIDQYEDSLRYGKEKDSLEYYKKFPSKYIAKRNYLDSLFVQSHKRDYHDSLISCYRTKIKDKPVDHVYYSSIKQYHNVMNEISSYEGDTINETLRFTRNYKKENGFVAESYSNIKGTQEVGDKKSILKGPLSRPSWFSPYDMSQSYYDISLRGNSDSTRLSFDFVGAIEVSNMIPVPDTITMSTIFFCRKDKIDEIKKHGLKFHVKFTELQNVQSFRLFLLSAILSALCAIFITFFVIASYINLFKKREKLKKQ